jgi:hypothetical protein
MTLPVSGPISFNDINVELGVAGTTNANINQASYRALAGVPSGTISLSDFYGKSSVAYYFDGLTLLGFNSTVATFDTSGNIYVIGTLRDGSYINIIKISTSNTISYKIQFPDQVSYINDILVSGSDTYYTTSQGPFGTTGPGTGRLSTSTGLNTWPQGALRYIGYSGFSSSGTNIHVNASGDTYITGNALESYEKSVYLYSFVSKINSSGNSVWYIMEQVPGNNSVRYKATYETGGYLYVYGQYVNDGSGQLMATITKVNPSTPTSVSASNSVRPSSITTNFYVVSGTYNDATSSHYVWGNSSDGGGLVANFNSSLTLQWIRYMAPLSGSSSDFVAWNRGTVDSSGNLYVSYTAYPNIIRFAKYNSSGTLQWARSIAVTGVALSFGTFNSSNVNSLSVYGDKLLLCFNGIFSDSIADPYAFVLQYKTDGSKSSGSTTLTVAGGRTATVTYSTYTGTASTPSSAVATSGGTGTIYTSGVLSSTGTGGYSTGSNTLYSTTVS